MARVAVQSEPVSAPVSLFCGILQGIGRLQSRASVGGWNAAAVFHHFRSKFPRDGNGEFGAASREGGATEQGGVMGRSVTLEEYAPQMIYAEEVHASEVDKMLRKPGEVAAFSSAVPRAS